MSAKRNELDVYGDIRILHRQVNELCFKFRELKGMPEGMDIPGMLVAVSDMLYEIEERLIEAYWTQTPLGDWEKRNAPKGASLGGGSESEVTP